MVTMMIEAFWSPAGRIREFGERMRKPRDNLIAERSMECANVRRKVA